MDLSENYKSLLQFSPGHRRVIHAARIAVSFLCASIIWLFLSDYIVDTRLSITSWGADINLGTIKALLYFVVIAALIYTGVTRFHHTIEKTELRKVQYFNECLYPIFILDRGSLTIRDANPAASKLYGFSKRDLQSRSLQFFQTEPVVPLTLGRQEVTHRNRWNSSFKAVIYWQTIQAGDAEVYCLHVLNFLGHIPEGALNISWEANEQALLRKMAGLEERLRGMAHQIKVTDEASSELLGQTLRFEEAGRLSVENARNAAVEKVTDLNELIESLDEIVWCYNVSDMRFEFLSSSVERVFEISTTEFLASPNPWEHFVHPLDREIISQRNMVAARDTKAEFQFRIITGRGNVKWVSEQLKMVRNESGSLVKVKGITSDITARRANEEKLRQRQAILDGVFNNDQEDFLVLNREGTIMLFNRRAERHANLFIGPLENGRSFFQTFLGHYQLVVENRFRQAVATRTAVSEELKLESEGQEPRWYCFSFLPVMNEAGEVQSVCFRGRDITQTRGMENALRMTKKNVEVLINNTTDWLWSVDRSGRLTTFNNAINSFFLEECGVGLELKTLMGSCGPIDEKWWRNIKNAFDGQRISTSGRYLNSKGKVRYYEASINPIMEQGWVAGAACLLRDTTASRIMLQKSINLNRRFRLLSKAANDAVWEWKKETNRITWNRAITSVFGFRPAEIGDFWAMIALVHDDDRQVFTRDLLGRVEEGQRVWESRIRMRDARGTYRHVLCRAYMHYKKGDAEVIVGSLQDVTKLVEAEYAERRGNERYELASRATGDAIYDHDLVTDTVCWGDGYRNLFAYATQYEAGRHWLEKVHPEDRESVRTTLQAVIASSVATSWRGEYRFRRNDGTYAHVLDRGFVVRGEAGAPLRMIGAVMDQSEKVNYIAEIRRLSTVASRTNSMVLICRDDFSIEWANQSFLDRLNISLNQIADQSCLQFFQNKLENPLVLPRIRTVLYSGQNAKEELGIKDAEGYVNWWRLDAAPTQTDPGHERQFIMIFSDISEQKAYESRILNVARELANLIERANAVIFGVDRNGYVNEWNEVTAAVTGYSKNEVYGRKLLNFIPELDSYGSVVADLKNGKSVANVEFVFPAKCGKDVMLLLNATPRRDTNGTIAGFLIVGQDVTELVEYRTALERKVDERTRELNEALQQQIELVNMKRRFVSVASHEFRTPLSTINFSATYLRRYRKKIADAEMEQKLATIQQQVKHMSFLLEDVLTISKNESNQIKVNLVQVDLIDLLNTIAHEVGEAHANSHIVNVCHHTEKGISLKADPNLLRNIFVNLINNAIKFSPGGKEVVIGVEMRVGEAVFTVTDRGIGIPAEDMEKIFDAFHRGSNTAGIDGTGLGLNIVKRAVELLSGRISVASEPEKGSIFTVTLPVAS